MNSSSANAGDSFARINEPLTALASQVSSNAPRSPPPVSLELPDYLQSQIYHDIVNVPMKSSDGEVSTKRHIVEKNMAMCGKDGGSEEGEELPRQSTGSGHSYSNILYHPYLYEK